MTLLFTFYSKLAGLCVYWPGMCGRGVWFSMYVGTGTLGASDTLCKGCVYAELGLIRCKILHEL